MAADADHFIPDKQALSVLSYTISTTGCGQQRHFWEYVDVCHRQNGKAIISFANMHPGKQVHVAGMIWAALLRCICESHHRIWHRLKCQHSKTALRWVSRAAWLWRLLQ